MGHETEDLYGAHFIQGGLQSTSGGGTKPTTALRALEETPNTHFSNFSNGFRQSVLNGFSPWTNSSSSSSSSSQTAQHTQLQSASNSLSSLFHSHHPLSHQHPYYGSQAHTHGSQHLAHSGGTLESRFVRCWEETTTPNPILTPQSSQLADGFPGGLSAPADHSDCSPGRYETVKPENNSPPPPPSESAPEEDSNFVSLAKVGPEAHQGAKDFEEDSDEAREEDGAVKQPPPEPSK
ncbi:hypothetical protein CRUP_007149 [Coryphaenoides rupestris]|nr:hypothetical protein CRUP_007149 [Coryphaenoides rupestris]